MTEYIDRTQPLIIGMRHGQTEYTNVFPDLTPTGIQQIKDSTKNIEDILALYNRFVVISSPAARAQGSTKTFIKTSGIEPEKVLVSEDLRPFDIMDLTKFLEFQEPFGSKVLAEMWLTDLFFDSEANCLTEKRKDVNKRAMNFLSGYLAKIQENVGEPICTVLHTHTEILANYLSPVEKAPGPQNGETVILQPDKYNPKDLTIRARSKLVKARLNSSDSFELLA